MECERGSVALAYGLLCETSERSLSFAEFSDRAPLTKLYPSLKNFPPHVRDSLGFWIPRRGFRIPGTRFLTFPVELGFRIPMVSRIPDSLSCVPDSMSKKFSDSVISIPLHRVKIKFQSGPASIAQVRKRYVDGEVWGCCWVRATMS